MGGIESERTGRYCTLGEIEDTMVGSTATTLFSRRVQMSTRHDKNKTENKNGTCLPMLAAPQLTLWLLGLSGEP